MTTIPIIDLAPFLAGRDDGRTAAAVDDALRSIGFFLITGHGVPAPLVAETNSICKAFFDLPMDQKMQIKNTAAGSHRGYIPYGESALAFTYGGNSPPDLKESFGMGPPELPGTAQAKGPYYSPNVWPAAPAGFERTVTAYYQEMVRLTLDMMRLFAEALRMPPDTFARHFAGHHNSTLRALNYPDQPGDPLPGQLRAGAHTDYGAITILLGEDRPGGLQIRTRGGDWIDARPPANSFVINIGDLMMYWTNDVWLSNVHRVANPPRDAFGSSRRQSIAFFGNPREDALVECIPTCIPAGEKPKHPPVLAGEHRMKKIRAAAEQREAVLGTHDRAK